MPWANWFAVTFRSSRVGWAVALALVVGGGNAAASLPPPPRSPDDAAEPYVQDVRDLRGTVTVRRLRCRAPGQPDVAADFFLLGGGAQYRVGRLTYNAGARTVLAQGRTFPITRQYYDRYVGAGEAFSGLTLNAALGLWRIQGWQFRLGGVQYRCEVR